MDILSGLESLQHMFVTREMRHQSQFYLRVVRRQEDTTRVGNDCTTDELSAFGSHGQILQVGVAGREAPCGGDSLIVGGVYLTGSGIDIRGEGFDIGGDEFLEFTLLQYLAHDGMFVAQGLQYFLRGGVFAGLAALGLLIQVQAVEEYLAHLCRRVDIKLGTRQGDDFFLQFKKFGG